MANFYNRFLQSVERWPDFIAVEIQRFDGPVERLTYSQLRTMAESLGRWLLSSGLERASRCAILAANGPRWIAAYLGTVAAGMVAVPLDTAFDADQVAKLLRASGSSLLFVDAKHLPTAQRAIAGSAGRLMLLEPAEPAVSGPDFDALLKLGPDGFTPVAAPGDEAAAILYTSGTTSDPKGVMLTHDNFHAETEGAFRLVDITPHDAILGVLPLFHALAQMANLLLPLAGGARVVFLESLNTAELLRALRERDITLFCCVPQFFYLIHERIHKEIGARGRLAETVFRWLLQLSRFLRRFGLNLGKLLFRPVHAMLGPKMRYLISGGSKLDAGIARDFHAMGFELLQGYGLTETTGGAIGTPPHDNVIGSIGKPLHGMELKFADPKPPEDGTGPAIGEILLRGPLVMKGYYARPEATAEAIRDGWLHTGDLGYSDANGNVFITGREKEVIVLSNGKNIYPDEIEAHYLKSPFVKEICVLGLQGKPGEPFAERLHAVVVPNFEVLRERKIVNAREIIRFDIETLSAQLPSTKRILGFDIWQDDLPRTTTRKIKRFEVERRVKEGHAAVQDRGGELARPLTDEERQWLAEPDVGRAIAAVARAANIGETQVHPRGNLELDLGLDSMERVELLVALERELGAYVPDAVVSEVYTVRELVDAVRQRIGRAGGAEERAAWDSILNTDPADPEVLAVALRRPIAERLWYLLGRLVNLFVRDRFGLTVTGLEKLPQHGPFIISPNHQSYLDPPVLVSALPYSIFRDAFYVGTSEIFGNGLLRVLARSIKIVPVDPDANLVPAMRAGSYGLRRGKVLILYPEGERSIDGTPKVFKKGAAILATHLKVPICPVAMDGFFAAWPRGKGFQKFTRLHIAFGDPIYPPQQVDHHEVTYNQLTAALKSRVVKMWLDLHELRQPRTAAD
ncbi:MAG: AMP-binding protein [Acidobacteriia bacterium]|nr:AMP-binding protein [Terriglobia bacterium]